MARFGFLTSAYLLGSCASLWGMNTASSPQMPFFFAENHGQTDARVRATGTGPRFLAWFEEHRVVLRQGDATTRIVFENAAPHPVISTRNPIGASANYLRGSNAAHWQTGVPLFASVHYEGIWPGVEMTFRQEGAGLKVEYTVAPGSDIGKIQLRFDGTVTIEPDGGLVARNSTGEFREKNPWIYQDGPNGRVTIRGGFAKTASGLVTFTAAYDHTRPLVIDPSIQFSGYFGGAAQDNIMAVTTNAAFSVIVAGWSNSRDLPTSQGARVNNGGGVDAFVAAFSPAGGQLLYCTYLGGTGDDRAFGVAVDAANNTYVTGWSSSVNFPVLGPLQSRLSGARDAFVTKLNPAGDAIVYSTYFGGSGVDLANAIAVDALGQAVITGDTTSMNLPTTTGAFQRIPGGGQDAFVTRLSASGSSLSFSTYFGGNNTDHATSLQLDPAGPVVIGGGTSSTNLPVLQAYQARSGGGQDGFVTKFNPTATGLLISTYLGGASGSPGLPEQVNAISVGPSRNIVVAGITSSSNFPVTGSYQPVYGGGQTDGFLTKLNANTGALMVSTFLGGSSNDGINGLAGDALGRLYFTGFTLSTDFPIKNAPQPAPGGGIYGSMEAVAGTMNSGMNQLTFSTYLGGSGSDSGNAIAVDTMTSIIVAGQTSSPDFPSAGGNLKSIPTQILSSFVTRLAPDWMLSVASGPAVLVDAYRTGGYGGVATSLTYGLEGDIPVGGDWTGSGIKRVGIFRNGTWILDTNGDGVLNAGDQIVAFGQTGDIPIVGDWNGSGKIKLGLFRAGTFILDLSGHLSGVATGVPDATFTFGLATDIPVVSDWNASGFAKVGVFRNGSWLVDYNGDRLYNTLDKTYTYGQAGDIPVTGNWDSSGLTRIGVYRAGTWILNFAGTNVLGLLGQTDLSIAFGSPGQTPVVR